MMSRDDIQQGVADLLRKGISPGDAVVEYLGHINTLLHNIETLSQEVMFLFPLFDMGLVFNVTMGDEPVLCMGLGAKPDLSRCVDILRKYIDGHMKGSLLKGMENPLPKPLVVNGFRTDACNQVFHGCSECGGDSHGVIGTRKVSKPSAGVIGLIVHPKGFYEATQGVWSVFRDQFLCS